MARVPTPDAARGLYGISVAAELVGMGVQNLRLYEARGLLAPDRTGGGTRRYSADDLDRLRHIGDLLDAGLNLAGIAMVLDLEEQNTALRTEKEDPPMAHDRIDPGDQIPEADLLEQHASLEAQDLAPGESPLADPPLQVEVDEADRAEQLAQVPVADEDYPHDPPASASRRAW